VKFSVLTSTVPDGNMSPAFEDSPETWANRERFFKENGINPQRVASMKQIHSALIIETTDPIRHIGCDGLVTVDKTLWLSVAHADCMPLFFYSENPYILGAAHVGWKGLVSQLPLKMVEQFVKKGANLERIIVQGGPFICEKHYDVDLTDKRKDALPHVTLESGKIGLDMRKETLQQLQEAGINSENIHLSPECTAEFPGRYSSYHVHRAARHGAMVTAAGVQNVQEIRAPAGIAN